MYYINLVIGLLPPLVMLVIGIIWRRKPPARQSSGLAYHSASSVLLVFRSRGAKGGKQLAADLPAVPFPFGRLEYNRRARRPAAGVRQRQQRANALLENPGPAWDFL